MNKLKSVLNNDLDEDKSLGRVRSNSDPSKSDGGQIKKSISNGEVEILSNTREVYVPLIRGTAVLLF